MEQTNYKIKIEGVDLLSKNLFHLPIDNTNMFNHQLKTQAVGDSIKNIVIVFLQVRISSISEPVTLLGEINIAMRFGIENFKEAFPKNEQDKYLIPIEVENLLKSISISTLRGIMYSEFRGTLLHNAILPIILMDSLQPTEGNLFETPAQIISE